MLEIGRQMLSNAGAFTFTFLGNFDEAKLRPLIEQYIASLPGDSKKAKTYKQMDMYVKGEVANHFTRKMETPKCIALEMWTAKMPYSLGPTEVSLAMARNLSLPCRATVRWIPTSVNRRSVCLRAS